MNNALMLRLNHFSHCGGSDFVFCFMRMERGHSVRTELKTKFKLKSKNINIRPLD